MGIMVGLAVPTVVQVAPAPTVGEDSRVPAPAGVHWIVTFDPVFEIVAVTPPGGPPMTGNVLMALPVPLAYNRATSLAVIARFQMAISSISPSHSRLRASGFSPMN